MRFSQYKGILEILDSVIEATEYMRNNITNELCEICIQSLQSVQNTLVSEQQKCGDVEKNISIAIDHFENKEYNSDELYALVIELKEKAKTNIRYKLRVLFVAELGGKWDSMASVYDAFCKRDDCDVDVVLEPIFREVQYSDGSTKREVIYKDWLTPLGIKHILYDHYDMASICPDITFFSQPYESCTLPMFWPENMSKYSKVVFLPYYTCIMMDRKNPIYSDIFFESPTEKFSWKIACQSKYMKKYYSLYASRKGENVLVTGLPKWDYPYNLTKENTPCPDEWKMKIKNKKVFLWNTHFTIGDSCLLDRFDEFISIFENSNDIALIWRPHPMLHTIVKLYFPDEYQKYLELIHRIEVSSNMMIDKNDIYGLAFVWSDALITEVRSLAEQYLFMDKPILYTVNITDEEIQSKYYTEDKLFDFLKIPFSNSIDKTKKFISNICADNDVWKNDRKSLKDTYLSLADGSVGLRLSNELLRDFRTENIGSKYNTIIETIKKNKYLIIGEKQNNVIVSKILKQNNVNFIVADIEKNYIDCIKEDNYEFILISSEGKADWLLDIIVGTYGVEKKRVLKFWNMYEAFLPELVCDRVCSNPRTSIYEGIILGISHSEVGIFTEKLKYPFCNLAVSSQDLFYQSKTLEHVLNTYPEKFKNLKYAIIDLYDYRYFNYDTSLSTSALKYISFGGYNKDSHNFEQNKNFNFSYEDAIAHIYKLKYKGIETFHENLWETDFKGADIITNYKGYRGNFDLSNRFRVVSENDIASFNYQAGSIRKIHHKTIEENIEILKHIFNTLIKQNPNMKIYTIIIPKFIETEINLSNNMAKFVPIFKDIINEMHNCYEFEMLDFNNLSDLSFEKLFYYDAENLNYFGATWLTDRLNDLIAWEE